MRFVVPIPLSLYLIFVLIAFSIGMYVFAFAIAIGFVYILFRAPKETIGLVLLLLAFKYWKITLPILVVGVVINHFFGSKPDKKKISTEIAKVGADEKEIPQREGYTPNA